MKTEIYGTIGPACSSEEKLYQMFENGMTGCRLNLSHTTLEAAADQIGAFHAAAKRAGVKHPKLLVDMQGPELRIGKLKQEKQLETGSVCAADELQIPELLKPQLNEGQKLLIDDGKIEAVVHRSDCNAITIKITRGGLLKSGKSIAVDGLSVQGPAVTAQDFENLCHAKENGVTGIMQPFVRSASDLKEVREAMEKAGCEELELFAKVENLEGVRNLSEFLPLADQIVIARGDLGNAVPLWELPGLQKKIEKICIEAGKPFMVVTQMLASMEHSAVPTRAEVSDIYNSVADGAASVMVTGETAVGEYPAEVIRYLANTAAEAAKDAAAAAAGGR